MSFTKKENRIFVLNTIIPHYKQCPKQMFLDIINSKLVSKYRFINIRELSGCLKAYNNIIIDNENYYFNNIIINNNVNILPFLGQLLIREGVKGYSRRELSIIITQKFNIQERNAYNRISQFVKDCKENRHTWNKLYVLKEYNNNLVLELNI